MNKGKRIAALIAAAVVQLGIMMLIISSNDIFISVLDRFGTDMKFQTEMISVERGGYVVPDIRLSVPESGEYAVLSADENGFAEFGGISDSKPKDKPYLYNTYFGRFETFIYDTEMRYCTVDSELTREKISEYHASLTIVRRNSDSDKSVGEEQRVSDTYVVGTVFAGKVYVRNVYVDGMTVEDWIREYR